MVCLILPSATSHEPRATGYICGPRAASSRSPSRCRHPRHLWTIAALTSFTTSQASESRLFRFSGETKAFLRKFRLSTSRASGPKAVVFLIDKATYEVRQDDDQIVYENLDELCDELPDHSPRYVLLSYPVTKSDGRATCPYVMLYYLPVTCNAEARMVYAGAKELVRNTSEVGRVIDFASKDDIDEILDSLKAD